VHSLHFIISVISKSQTSFPTVCFSSSTDQLPFPVACLCWNKRDLVKTHIYHPRSDSGGMFSVYVFSDVHLWVCSCVCLSVCLSVNSITLEPSEISSWNSYGSKMWLKAARTCSKTAALRCTAALGWRSDVLVLKLLVSVPQVAVILCVLCGQWGSWIHLLSDDQPTVGEWM